MSLKQACIFLRGGSKRVSKYVIVFWFWRLFFALAVLNLIFSHLILLIFQNIVAFSVLYLYCYHVFYLFCRNSLTVWSIDIINVPFMSYSFTLMWKDAWRTGARGRHKGIKTVVCVLSFASQRTGFIQSIIWVM